MIPALLTGKRVLLVEDEFLVALLVEDALTEAGCVVLGPFSRVRQALDALHGLEVDAAVLDVNVAGEMVFPVAEALEARGVPFLFVTGYGQSVLPWDRPHWEACAKPFEVDDLFLRLARRLTLSPGRA